MSKVQKWKVVRQHIGDRPYVEGEVRVGTEAEFAHLIPHVLQPLDAKAAPKPANKAAPKVANKADNRRKAKTA